MQTLFYTLLAATFNGACWGAVSHFMGLNPSRALLLGSGAGLVMLAVLLLAQNNKLFK